MRKKTADQIRLQTVDAYAIIAEQYDDAHQTAWRGLENCLSYVKKDADILDLGCGNGWLYDFIRQKSTHYLGVDNSSALLDLARSNFPEARFQLGDMVDLDFPQNSFDIVFSLASFHHIPNAALRRKNLEEVHCALRDNGILILTVWNLFQWKFIRQWAGSILSFVFHFGLKYAWNDIWIPWRQVGPNRYFHAFLPHELLGYFTKNLWTVEEFYFLRKGSRVKFWQSFNLCLVVQKKNG